MSSDPIEMLRLAAKNAAHVIRNCVNAGSIVADYLQYADDIEDVIASLSDQQPSAEAQPMSDDEVRQWIGACNHEPSRQVLRDYLQLRTAPPSAPVAVEGLLDCLPLEIRAANGYEAAWAAGFNEGVLESRQNLQFALAKQSTTETQENWKQRAEKAEKWWGEVCDALSKADPDWMLDGPGGIESAVAMIHKLAARPVEAQPVGYLWKETQDGEEVIGFRAGPGYRSFALANGDTPLYAHPPPSVPVEARLPPRKNERGADSKFRTVYLFDTPHEQGRFQQQVEAFYQQPADPITAYYTDRNRAGWAAPRRATAADTPPSAPVGVPVDVVREYLDARACYEAATRPPNSHAPAPTLKHGDPVVLRLREARVELDTAIVLAQQPVAKVDPARDLRDRMEFALRRARNIASYAGENPDQGAKHADGMRRACNIIEAALADQPGGSDNDR